VIKATILMAAALAVPPAHAAGVADCIAIDNDLDRLVCYDREAGRTPVVTDMPAAAAQGKWQSRTETSALTDPTNVYLYVLSEEVIDCGWNEGDRITLVVRCVENTTALVFQTACHMTSSDYNSYGDVDYRIDERAASAISMTESTNNRSLGLWNGGRSIPMIKSLFGAERLVTRMTPYGENSFTATFDITGLEEAAAPLRQACGW
jgi:type VI secretion system protein VasI